MQKKQHALYNNEIPGTQEVKMNPVKRHPRLINREIETLWNNNKEIFQHALHKNEILKPRKWKGIRSKSIVALASSLQSIKVPR